MLKEWKREMFSNFKSKVGGSGVGAAASGAVEEGHKFSVRVELHFVFVVCKNVEFLMLLI
jgi:hypothetical protein